MLRSKAALLAGRVQAKLLVECGTHTSMLRGGEVGIILHLPVVSSARGEERDRVATDQYQRSVRETPPSPFHSGVAIIGDSVLKNDAATPLFVRAVARRILPTCRHFMKTFRADTSPVSEKKAKKKRNSCLILEKGRSSHDRFECCCTKTNVANNAERKTLRLL